MPSRATVKNIARQLGTGLYTALDSSAADVSQAARTSIGHCTIPANTLSVGDVIHVFASGDMQDGQTEDLTEVSLNLGPMAIDATTGEITGSFDALFDLGATITAAGPQHQTNDDWILEVYATVRAVGIAGTADLFAGGWFALDAPATNPAANHLINCRRANTNADTTVAQFLSVAAQFAAGGNDTLRLEQMIVQINGTYITSRITTV